MKLAHVNDDDTPDTPASADSRDGLTAPVRRSELVRHIEAHGPVRLEELVDMFRVSAMTIHRDLDYLAREGLIERVRGGARAKPHPFAEQDVRLRRVTRVALKNALAAEAALLIRPGDVVAFDDSTTVAAMLAHLGERAPSAVVTHALGLMRELTLTHPQITLVGLGGQYVLETDSFLGAVVVEQLSRVSADVVFVSTTALKNDALFHPDAAAAETKRALLARADRTVLLLDDTKFEGKGLYHVADLADFDDVVVNAELAPEHRASLDALAARVPTLQIHYVSAPTGG
ncbi:DeoR/GlpR family DNA-binding transcription regulator [Cryobacterium frigoriphilum]|nr:DeoR/GlpR family DNA-binding transcription regulator [Cryobacterium frigoriphilum]